MTDTNWAFAQYENVRKRLPDSVAHGACQRVPDLGALADEFDVFLFDAYGVLNVGNTPIAGAPARVAALQSMGKRALVLTNGASFPASDRLPKYQQYGFNFTADDVISSREALASHLATLPEIRWAAMAPKGASFEGLGVSFSLLEDTPQTYANAEGFLLLGSQIWNDTRQSMLVETLRAHPRPVLVGNPDLVAPYEHGFNLQPGLYAHWLADKTGLEPQFFGKPFAGMFTEAQRRFGAVPPERVLMIGDTLHTDILGGAAAGFKTLLVEDHGMFRGTDVLPYIEKSGIAPDYITPTI
ncbi:MAG TPA: HAD-IIA family hydrolase [Rhodobacteraceae bacterium]|nr:HAD-IIA family hydrolase [Paracoccaceae bacterium]